MMYWWLHDMDGDTGYWKEYLATTYPEVFDKNLQMEAFYLSKSKLK